MGDSLGKIGLFSQVLLRHVIGQVRYWRGRKAKRKCWKQSLEVETIVFHQANIADSPVCGKAELRLSPFLMCSNSIFWRHSGEIPVKLWRHSGEILVRFWKSALNCRKPKQPHNSASPHPGNALFVGSAHLHATSGILMSGDPTSCTVG